MPKGIQGFQKGHVSFIGITGRQKIGKASKQRCTDGLCGFEKGHTPWNKDRKFSEKPGHNKGKHWKIKDTSNMYKFKKGIKNPAWKGGVTPLIEKIRKLFQYRQWRSDVFTRDDFTCQECGKRGSNLEAHHIESFNIILEKNKIKTYQEALDCEELWNINNGITFCYNCHKEFHKKYGRQHNNQEQLKKFLTK